MTPIYETFGQDSGTQAKESCHKKWINQFRVNICHSGLDTNVRNFTQMDRVFVPVSREGWMNGLDRSYRSCIKP